MPVIHCLPVGDPEGASNASAQMYCTRRKTSEACRRAFQKKLENPVLGNLHACRQRELFEKFAAGRL